MSKLRDREKPQVQVEFGNHLKQKRREAGLTQEELAEKSGLDHTYIGSIERGERNVSLGNVVALAQALLISPNELIPGPHHRKKNQAKVEFGKRLKNKRKELGLTEEALAKKADLDLSYIESVERGDENITFERIIALAEALQISPKELMPEQST